MAARLVLASVFLLATALAGCSDSGDDDGGHTDHSGVTHDVAVSNFAFAPANLDVKVGDSVKWTVSSGSHTVDGAGGIDSGTLGQGQSYTRAFHEPGSYAYKCDFHAQMVGTVMVSA